MIVCRNCGCTFYDGVSTDGRNEIAKAKLRCVEFGLMQVQDIACPRCDYYALEATWRKGV